MAPLIYAHRGASFDFPEMSLVAYQAAIDQGADGFECDLRLTKDGVLVCWHDANMKRIANRNFNIADSTYAEIRETYPIVRLAELIDLALMHRKGLALETKHPVPTRGAVERELLRILENYRSQIVESGIDVAIMSFSWLAMVRLRQSPWNTVYLASHRWFYIFNVGRAIGPSVAIISKLHKIKFESKKVFVWTANTESEILLCKSKGVDVMMTDRPAFARAILESV